MSQYRARWKGRSLGQTVTKLQDLANYCDVLLSIESARALARDALYHISKLRGKLHRLNLKIQREAKR